MTGAGGVVALVMLEWTVGLIGLTAWTQSWAEVKRGHFRITAWVILALAAAAFAAARSTGADGPQSQLVIACLVGCALYVLVQYSRTDVPGAVIGGITALVGCAALAASGATLAGWPAVLAALELIAGAALLGGVTSGMLLGHWYLNQPGLKTWALARLTVASLIATGATAILGLIATGRLANASTEGAVLGIPGFGDSFGAGFFVIWLLLVGFTGVVTWMVRRCIKIRSIQSATGLYYVALLTAGVSEFLIRYLMVNVA